MDHLTATGIVELFPIPDDVDRLPVRRLHLSCKFSEWIDNTLAYRQEIIGGRTVCEHLEQFFIDFRCNERLHATDLRRMMPTSNGVWKMHPPMLRVYGWVPRPHSFVAIWAELGEDTKTDKGLNDRCLGKVLEFIRKHGITDIVYGDFLSAFPQQT